MLSILIPTFNYNVYPLAKELNIQALECNINFEILVYDDGSNSVENIENSKINELENCLFKELPSNIGRSAIRNSLGSNAKYENLLFIDARTFPKKNDFIYSYIQIKNKSVINGGVTCLNIPPKRPYKLRWLYTKKREKYLIRKDNIDPFITSSNFLIKKNVFMSNLFDESLKKYGYEDLVFFDHLIKNRILIYCFNNPVVHNADDDANTFIKKTELAIENLIYLLDNKKIINERIGITRYYSIIDKFRLNKLLIITFNLIKPLLKLNFNSSYPSILFFDFYRLGYFCQLKTKN